VVVSCNAGYGDCDGDPGNGCETPLNTTTNCGACGVECSVANGTAGCSGGACVVAACNPGYAYCGGTCVNAAYYSCGCGDLGEPCCTGGPQCFATNTTCQYGLCQPPPY
jgi:hypothetical protein